MNVPNISPFLIQQQSRFASTKDQIQHKLERPFEDYTVYPNVRPSSNSAGLSLALQETTVIIQIACQYATFSPYQPPALID
jgi:hypothetical protein